jgi:hypothetical protein
VKDTTFSGRFQDKNAQPRGIVNILIMLYFLFIPAGFPQVWAQQPGRPDLPCLMPICGYASIQCQPTPGSYLPPSLSFCSLSRPLEYLWLKCDKSNQYRLRVNNRLNNRIYPGLSAAKARNSSLAATKPIKKRRQKPKIPFIINRKNWFLSSAWEPNNCLRSSVLPPYKFILRAPNAPKNLEQAAPPAFCFPLAPMKPAGSPGGPGWATAPARGGRRCRTRSFSDPGRHGPYHGWSRPANPLFRP